VFCGARQGPDSREAPPGPTEVFGRSEVGGDGWSSEKTDSRCRDVAAELGAKIEAIESSLYGVRDRAKAGVSNKHWRNCAAIKGGKWRVRGVVRSNPKKVV
jgi:hypothetical protein